MPEQFDLPGFDPAPQSRPRAWPQHRQRAQDTLFFAIFPDPDVAARIAKLAGRLRDEYGLKGGLLRTERFHVTLHDLGGYLGVPQDVVDAAKEAAAAVTMPSFDVVFDRVMSFSGGSDNRPLVLRGGDGTAALMTFRQTLGAAMVKAGLKAARSYTPHMTLLYGGHNIPEQIIEAVGWTAKEFVLVHSIVGATVHELLGRWPLRG